MLRPNQIKAARLLATGLTQDKVAGMCAVTPRTIRNWLQEQEFQQYMEKIVVRHTELIEGALLDGEMAAVGTLTEALTADAPSGGPDWPTRLKAALRFLDSAGKRGTPTQKVEQKSLELKGDLNELFANALRDPGVRKRLSESGLLPVPPIEDAEYEVIDDGLGETDPSSTGGSGGSTEGPE